MRNTLLGMALIAIACPAVAAPQYLRFGKLVDGKGKVWTNVAVVVENGRISAVEPDGRPPSKPMSSI
jgi:imidazolonepropionase-like amidohydrolase